MIIKEEDIKKRGLLFKHLLLTANELKNMQNYNGCNTIISAFNNSAIFRLKKTFSLLSKKDIQIFDDLSKLVSSNSNFKEHRDILDVSVGSCIPCFGMFLTDLTFIEDGSKNYNSKGLFLFFL
jgi:son of sevenless